VPKSPLVEYCEAIDLRYADKSYMELYKIVLGIDKKYFTNLVLSDFKFRASHQQNVVMSIEGLQGCGKSLFGIALGIILGRYYDNPFLIERDIYVNPRDLDFDLRNDTSRRRTFLYDEQPQRTVGIGSASTQIGLSDYEEICRYTQNNLIYCSPEIYDHAHYFLFEQIEFDPPRVKNEKCIKCPKSIECKKNFYKTLCEIPFHERDGYPKEFNFLLKTKRLADKSFVPRGIVSLPVVAPDIAERYDKVKQKNIQSFEKFQAKSTKKLFTELDEFAKEYEQDLLMTTSRGVYKPIGLRAIEGLFYKKFGFERFTKSQVDVFVPIIKQSLLHKCEKLNNEDAP